MGRLTKAEVVQRLRKGLPVSWNDAGKKASEILLGDIKTRNLFEFVLKSDVRSPAGLPQVFLDGLAKAFESKVDSASKVQDATATTAPTSSWKLNSIETEGFGGINSWNGSPFKYEFDCQSLFIEGPNGSGKSSFTGAIIWALTGERPRDYGESPAHSHMPVVSEDLKTSIGTWPPLASYPTSKDDLKVSPTVRVTLEFKDQNGNTALVKRKLENDSITYTADPAFNVADVMLETGLLMPARIASIRLGTSKNRLTDAVQLLTGMDDLVDIGILIIGLSDKRREYLSYGKKELRSAKDDFELQIKTTRSTLYEIGVALPAFEPADTGDKAGAMAQFGKRMSDESDSLTATIENDLASDLKLDSLAGQTKAASCLSFAENDLLSGIEGLTSWKLLSSFASAVGNEEAETIRKAISESLVSAKNCLRLAELSKSDSKFQLKASAALWHAQHHSGQVTNCPVCEEDLAPFLRGELESLKKEGEASRRTFDENVSKILESLNASIPLIINKQVDISLEILQPRDCMASELKAKFVDNKQYSSALTGFTALSKTAVESAPACTQKPKTESATCGIDSVDRRISVLNRLLELSAWFRENEQPWKEWWKVTVGEEATTDPEPTAAKPGPEQLRQHLSRLSTALMASKPYKTAAESMRKAWKAGLTIVQIETEINRRLAIAESLAPLASLVPLCQSIAKEAIDDLSGNIGKWLTSVLIVEQFHFHDAQLTKKDGVVLYGGFNKGLLIDATLIANTSWLRAVLWGFTFALREEALGQLTVDPLPLMILDDPQATFDIEHRYRWSLYVASLQHISSPIQAVITSHDQMFLEQLKTAGAVGRHAVCSAVCEKLGCIGIFEGASIDRKWEIAKKLKTPEAAQDYLNKVRIYLEGLLKLMLRGTHPDVLTSVVGEAREKIDHLHASDIAPWNRSEFKNLVNALGQHSKEIKAIESSHHSSGVNLGMAEATDVELHWRKRLKQRLEDCFRIARDHTIIHGGLTALKGPAPTVNLPEGHKSKVAQIPLKVLGKAAALSDGRIADGCIDLNVYAIEDHKKIKLAQHSAFRLNASTLEPVARPGDMLIVHDEGVPTVKSLVVALSENKILARRFEIAENHSDVAVLTAQAINPRKIAPPVISHLSMFKLHKVVGVLYQDKGWSPMTSGDMEVCECSGEAVLSGVISDALGLVEVVGHSAEPHALNGQFLIVGKPRPGSEAIKEFDGAPVIASDTDDNRYFKRLRIGADRVVLESMDSGGDYAPVILALPGESANALANIWPVSGVLFELPK